MPIIFRFLFFHFSHQKCALRIRADDRAPSHRFSESAPHQPKNNRPKQPQHQQKQKQQPRPASNARGPSPADRAQLSLKELHRIVKKARAFETRKVVRKLKDLRSGGGSKKSAARGSGDDASDDDSDAGSDDESASGAKSGAAAVAAADPAEVAKLESDLALIKVDLSSNFLFFCVVVVNLPKISLRQCHHNCSASRVSLHCIGSGVRH